MQSDISSLLKDFDITIDAKLKLHLCGRDLLTVINKTNEEQDAVGGMCLDIQQGECSQQNKFLIFVSTKFRVDDNSVGISKLLSWVNENLEVIEEKRTEILKQRNGNIQKKDIYMAKMDDGGLYAHRFGTGNTEVVFRYPLAQIQNFVCEGANLILLKCLSLGRKCFREKLTTAINLDGDICKNIYSADTIQTSTMKQLLVKRVIMKPSGQETISYAGLGMCGATMGKFIELKWPESVIAVISLQADETMEHIDQVSAYMKRLSDKKAEFKYKISTRPNLIATLDDYVQDLLLHKPEYVLKYTKSYFRRFETKD